MSMEVLATADHNWSSQWRATLELTPGSHQLSASALHPSGLFTTNVSVWFTNNASSETVADIFDGAGNPTQRIWKSLSGTTNRTQTLTWDARGRLYEVSDRDSTTNGYDWYAYYDPLDRRIETWTYFFTNGVEVASSDPTPIRFSIRPWNSLNWAFSSISPKQPGNSTDPTSMAVTGA